MRNNEEFSVSQIQGKFKTKKATLIAIAVAFS